MRRGCRIGLAAVVPLALLGLAMCDRGEVYDVTPACVAALTSGRAITARDLRACTGAVTWRLRCQDGRPLLRLELGTVDYAVVQGQPAVELGPGSAVEDQFEPCGGFRP